MSKTKSYLCPDEESASGRFLMLPPELLESAAFQSLGAPGQMFLITLAVHRETEQQRRCLYACLQEYNRLLGLGWTDYDILNEAMPGKRAKYTSNFFVAPTSQLAAYGYQERNIKKLKKRLIDNGFIKVAFSGKGRHGNFSENVSVYRFVNDWKKTEKNISQGNKRTPL